MREMTPSGAAHRKSDTFRAAARAGIVLIATSAAALLALPSHMAELPAGMHTPIIAFELARTVDEVEQMFGPPGSKERAAYVQAMDRGNAVDFAFMIAYGTFLTLFARALRPVSPRAARAVPWLTIVAVCADALENRRLFEITASLGGLYGGALRALMWITWIKWGALACLVLLLTPGLLAHGRLGRITAALAALCATATVLAFLRRGIWAELMSGALAFTVLGAWIVALRAARAQQSV